MHNQGQQGLNYSKKELVSLYQKWAKEQKNYKKGKPITESDDKEALPTLLLETGSTNGTRDKNIDLKKSENIFTSTFNSTESIYKLKPKYLVTDFNFEAISATITENEKSFKNVGVFRTNNDLVGMSWKTKDELDHKDFRYPENRSFAGINLTYSYEVSGYTPLMNEAQAPVMTVKTYSGDNYYVRLWNYVINRPEDDWESGSGQYFPAGRNVEGGDTGSNGTIEINFDELYAGWAPYYWQVESTGIGAWKQNPEWIKVPINDIKEIMWSFAPQNFNDEKIDYLEEPLEYEVKFRNWTIQGSSFLCTEPSLVPVLPIRICDGYDDIYNMTPERVVGGYASLGYGETVNMYIGASHYYNKAYDSMDEKINILKEYPFNLAFEEWYKNYIENLKKIGVQNLIHSISMENVDPPESWKQKTWDGRAATTGWQPTPYLLSFTNQEVQNFYVKLVLNLARLSNQAGIRPIVQLGEPWWWFIEDGKTNSPCFYDESTKQLYSQERGKQMHIFRSGNDSINGFEDVLYFLRDKNGAFSHVLRDVVKYSYPDSLFTVLFFPPSVMDKNRVPLMMSVVNFPQEYWKYPNLDFFMLEDYDYLINNEMDKHDEALSFIQTNLAYPESEIHYFSGFVLDQSKNYVWNRIYQAINDSFNLGFAKTYVWAFAQVKRDGWIPQSIIYASKPSGNYKEPLRVALSCEGANNIIYTLDGSTPSNSHGMTYSEPININDTTTVTVISIKNGVESKPILFKYTMPVRLPIVAQISIDGNIDDWSYITASSSGDHNIFDLTAIQSEDTLFVLVRGSQMDTSSNLYIDNKSSANMFEALPWIGARANYMVSNGVVLKYTGSGQDWAWDQIGMAQIAKTPSVVELAIPLSLIEINVLKEIKIGFGRAFEDFAPPSGCKMIDVNKVLINPPTQVSEIRILPPSVTISVGETYILQATVLPSTISNTTVAWESDNTNVATIDENGKVFAKSRGTVTIVARAIMDTTKYSICTLTIEPLIVSHLKVYQYKRWPGKSEGPDSEIAPDLIINDKTKAELYQMNPVIGDIATLYGQPAMPPSLPEDGSVIVKNKAKGLATTFTIGDTSAKPIVEELFNHFFEGTGIDYRNSDLTQRVIDHESTQNYINIAKKEIIAHIRRNNGNPINALNDEHLKSVIDKCKPKFNTSDDRWNGLTISVNDTWGNYIEIKDFQCDGIRIIGKLKFTIYDHFGLDDGDVTGKYGGLAWLLGWDPEFAAWYVLQHYDGCNGIYKPFITYFETEILFDENFEGD